MSAYEKDGPIHMAELNGSKSSSHDDNPKLEQLETYQTAFDTTHQGPAALYRDGQLVKMPAASRDPRDPMNIPLARKIAALGCLSFFGALIASAELILGAALPVFAFEYAHYPIEVLVSIADSQDGFPAGSNPLKYLEAIGGPPIFNVFLLANVPVLVIGLANLFLVPMAIAVGRRPLVIALGCTAIGGALWASFSESLESHIAARAIQALGAGVVESLIPFIIQDITQVHERNIWISAAFACQGVIIIAIGFSAPYMIVNLSWRWLYRVTASIGALFLFLTAMLLPETRYPRTRAEMNGIPKDDAGVEYRPRTYKSDMRLWTGFQFKKGFQAFVDTLRTIYYPSVLFVTLLNAAVIASAFAAGFTAAPSLLTQPWSWPFQHLGLCLIPVLIGAVLVAIITGGVADWIANRTAKARGSRVPENQLLNLALPFSCSLIGALLFGLSGNNQTHYPWGVFLLSLGMLAFGFLGTSSITTVYVLECYPHIAGPVLVNVASVRWIIAFLLILYASDWIVDFGYERTYLIYVGLIAGFGSLIPIVYIFGPAWRKRFPGRLHD